MINIFDLKTEFDKNPIGINTSNPRFSWKYECSADIKIKYYQIKVLEDYLIFKGISGVCK